MDARDIVKKGRLHHVLKYNGIEMDLDLMEDLEVCIEGNIRELVCRFGNGNNDIDMIKNRMNSIMAEALEVMIMELHNNDPKYDITDQEVIYDTVEGIVYE
jgi:hypothetical protein